MSAKHPERVALLVGGVGGAKLALGLADVLPAEALTVVVNTADDFEHLGLHVSPDLDTVMYTLSGLANPKTGWGIAGDTFSAMEAVQGYGGPGWFNLGDRDLGTNLYRTALLREGHTLTEVTQRLSGALGITHTMLPMSDDPVRTTIETVELGTLAFQVYFVRERWQPTVKAIHFEGAAKAQPSAQVVAALEDASAIILGPSNPFLSIDPILAVPGIRQRLAASDAPVVAVSPIIGGRAIKGPAAKIMEELEIDVSPMGVLSHYGDLLDGFILDEEDEGCLAEVQTRGTACVTLPTLMKTRPDKVRLARQTLTWIEETF